MSGKNILMIIPNLDFGGAQRSFSSLANAMDRDNNVTIAVFNTNTGISFSYNPQILDLNIPGGQNVLSKIYFFIKRCQAVRKLKNRLAIETTISYLEGANYINALTGNDHKILSVRGSKYHDENIHGFIGWFRRKILIPITYRRAQVIVALNHGIKRELQEKMGLSANNIVVIRNFYDTEKIREMSNLPLEDKYQCLSNGPYLLYAGRLAPEKGLKFIIDLFTSIKARLPRYRLVIIGDGPISEDIQQYARSAGLKVFGIDSKESLDAHNFDVVFTGYQHNTYQYIKRADMLLLASDSEGGPNILMEALICGTTVVSTDCPYGPGEQLAPDHNGEVVEIPVEVAHGILLPPPGRDYGEKLVNQCGHFITHYLENPHKLHKINSRARKWVTEQSPELTLKSWKRIIG